MTYSTGMRSAACIAALVAGGAAQADVTAAQVWEDWKTNLAIYGEDGVTVGAEKMSGDTLTISDLVMRFDDSNASVMAEMGDIMFTEQRNGSVRVTMAESYPITITAEDGVVVSIDVSQSQLEVIVSGDADEMNYAVSADKYAIALDKIVDGDLTFTGDARLVANDMSGVYTTSTGNLRDITYEVNLASLDLLVDIEVPGAAGEYVTGSGKINNMSMEADMTLPVDADFENPDDLFANGFSVSGGYTVDSANYVFDVDADGEQMNGSISTGATRFVGEMSAQTMAYDTQVEDMAMNIGTSQLPFPIEVGLAQYGIGFAMPLGKSDEPADFGLNFDFIDLTINDMIWSMFDPGQVLPRDPATIQFDIAGKAKPLFDLLDPAQSNAIARADMPVELSALSLNSLKIALAGALITGDGDFTFDNSDTKTFDGMPRPEGAVEIEINGLNKLLDNLVAMGLVPEDQIMGGRMMLGMFARTTGDDQLTTQLEVNGEGHVLANGQRIR